MKKLVLVLVLAVAMMSCSKETVEVVIELPEFCYQIAGFSSEVTEAGYLLHYLEVLPWDGGDAFTLTINEDRWLDYKAEVAEFGFACWGN